MSEHHAKKKRSCKKCSKPYSECRCPAWMTFSMQRGFAWGQDHPRAGELPYWNTGKRATWAVPEAVCTCEYDWNDTKGAPCPMHPT